jgi:hypothetical protein
MKKRIIILTSLLISFLFSASVEAQDKDKIISIIGTEEYQRQMSLSLDDFDQSYEGFRQYSDDYNLVKILIPEYIAVNNLSASVSTTLHWHLGQIHAFNGEYVKAINEMKQSKFDGSPVYWNCYVDGSIAFLERDKNALEENLRILEQQENQMNIEFLEKFVKYFDKPYWEAYNADY